MAPDPTDDVETQAGEDGRFDTTLEATPERAEDGKQPWLFPVFPDAAEPILLRDAATLVGRAVPRGGVRLKDRLSSRMHASLLLEDGGVRLHNHSEKNGSFVDGARTEGGALDDGALLRFGDSLFVLRLAAALDLEDAAVPGLVGVSVRARALRRQLALVAPTEAWVMLAGETGSGKEVAARALHEQSGRRGPFVAVNCSAVPPELAESQFFGHKRGAFTGADRDADGWFHEAHGGTLFLDELGELPLPLQPKLLRALDERAVARVGERQFTPVDVRVVAATNRDLASAMTDGSFRSDLYARLADLTLELPPLRARREDVLLLLRHFLNDDKPLAADLAERLVLHPWPYNVRELKKVAVELAVRAQPDPHYALAHVERRLVVTRPAQGAASSTVPAISETDDEPTSTAADPRSAPTRDDVIALLQRHDGNVLEVAKSARRSRTQVYRWLESYGLDPKAFRPR